MLPSSPALLIWLTNRVGISCRVPVIRPMKSLTCSRSCLIAVNDSPRQQRQSRFGKGQPGLSELQSLRSWLVEHPVRKLEFVHRHLNTILYVLDGHAFHEENDIVDLDRVIKTERSRPNLERVA